METEIANICPEISSSLCVITSLPSRYRDTKTYLPYANSYAYREIQRTAAQNYSWSPMLGCYVGPVGIAARGVPERFLNPDADTAKETDTVKGQGETDGSREVNGAVETTPSTPAPGSGTAPPVVAGASDGAMDVDKA